MSLPIERSDHFLKDFELSFEWYAVHAGEDIAQRFVHAVETTLRILADASGLGARCRFRHAALHDLRFFLVQRPFHKNLVFYRSDERALYVERLIHGTRDLPRRLRESPGT
jgi:toxin ParE1/3/4